MTTVSSTVNFTPYLRVISYVLLLLLYHLIAVCRVLSVFEKACLASISTFAFPVSWSLYSLMVVYSFRIFIECGVMTAALG